MIWSATRELLSSSSFVQRLAGLVCDQILLRVIGSRYFLCVKIYLIMFLLSCIIYACILYHCSMLRWAWWDWELSGWLTILVQCFDTVGWVIRPVKKISSPKRPSEDRKFFIKWDVQLQLQAAGVMVVVPVCEQEEWPIVLMPDDWCYCCTFSTIACSAEVLTFVNKHSSI